MTVNKIMVEEGGKTILDSSIVTINSPYYRDRLDSLVVAKQPKFGTLQRIAKPGKRVDVFTTEELRKGIIEVTMFIYIVVLANL